MPEWIGSTTSTGAVTQLPIVHNDSQWIWKITQVTVTYSKNADAPNVGMTKNNVPAASSAPMQPGPGVNFPNTALTQTFAGEPPIWSEVSDTVLIVITQGSAGAAITAFVMYESYLISDPAIQKYRRT